MKALKNTKILFLEHAGNKGYFNIDCGRFGEMVFSFDIDFNIDIDGDLQSVIIELDNYDWECEEYRPGKFLNNRNTKMLCEYIEEIIFCDPYSFGFDPEAILENERDDYFY